MLLFEGRSIFVVDAPKLVRRLGAQGIANQLGRAHCAGVWIRVGRGEQVQTGLTQAICQELKDALREVGVRLSGWHVPFCATDAATAAEIECVLHWTDVFQLDGLIVDAERTPESPRFQGGAKQASTYTDCLRIRLFQRNIGLSFSSHDQPNLHQDLPFPEFLTPGQPVHPQVYNRDSNPDLRLHQSENAYQPLLGADFLQRYRPTANASIHGDIAFPDEATCLRSLDRFLDLVQAKGFLGHSFWCWEDAPAGFWNALAARPM